MRTLLTGMSAAQVNSVKHRWSPNFPGLIRDELVRNSDDVTWAEPSVLWNDKYLTRYDLVICGISPITALGANRCYGALSIIEQLWGDSRLRLLVDAPDPLKMVSANKSIIDHPDNLDKDFFRARREYEIVHSNPSLKKRLIKAVELLNTELWPTTIVPSLPWQVPQHFAHQLPLAAGRLQLLNLDALLFHMCNLELSVNNRFNRWAYEAGTHPNWVRHQNLTWPLHGLPKTHRRPIIAETLVKLANSAGTIIAPSKSGTWWSPRFAMSLSHRTPVFTDWHETQFLSTAWTHLPSAFELMDQDKREQLGDEQFASYVSMIPDLTT